MAEEVEAPITQGLRVIKSTPPHGSTMTVTVFSEKRSDFEGKAAQTLAKQHAISQGFGVRGLSNIPQVKPVNENGETTPGVINGTEEVVGYTTIIQFGASPN